MSKEEIAELATGPLDYQDRFAARGYEVAPSTLAFERDQMLLVDLGESGGVLPAQVMSARRAVAAMTGCAPSFTWTASYARQ